MLLVREIILNEIVVVQQGVERETGDEETIMTIAVALQCESGPLKIEN